MTYLSIVGLLPTEDGSFPAPSREKQSSNNTDANNTLLRQWRRQNVFYPPKRRPTLRNKNISSSALKYKNLLSALLCVRQPFADYEDFVKYDNRHLKLYSETSMEASSDEIAQERPSVMKSIIKVDNRV